MTSARVLLNPLVLQVLYNPEHNNFLRLLPLLLSDRQVRRHNRCVAGGLRHVLVLERIKVSLGIASMGVELDSLRAGGEVTSKLLTNPWHPEGGAPFVSPDAVAHHREVRPRGVNARLRRRMPRLWRPCRVNRSAAGIFREHSRGDVFIGCPAKFAILKTTFLVFNTRFLIFTHFISTERSLPSTSAGGGRPVFNANSSLE